MDKTRTIELTKGFVAVVDAADYPALSGFSWFAQVVQRTLKSAPHVSAARMTGRRIVYMHRQIIGARVGQIVDHINRNPLDNRRGNLRFCTTSGNTANRVYANPLGFRGVYERRGKFGFQISAGRQNGRAVVRRSGFVTLVEAARAYDVAARALHGEFAVLNFPDDHALPSSEQPGGTVA